MLSAGGVCLASAVLDMGDHVLEVFYRNGMEPTMAALLEYAQIGLGVRNPLEAKPSRRQNGDGMRA